MYKDIVIVSAARTPFGRYCGSLKEYDYFDLGALPMKEVLERVKNAPTKCPSCGGAINQPILRGMVSLSCEYCGDVIRF